MQYLCLIYEAEKIAKARNEDDMKEVFQAYGEFTTALKGAGKMVAGDALEEVATATTVRIRDGKVLHTDGPFAETKEQLGGYYLIEAADLDEALKWAAKIPSAKSGSIEVRPIMQYGGDA